MNGEMQLSPWAVMWLLASGLFGLGKIASAYPLWCVSRDPVKVFQFTFLWPGMNAAEWTGERRSKKAGMFDASLRAGTLWLFAGVCLLFLASTISSPYLAGLSVMLAVLGVLHFGLFEVLAWYWQKRGVPVRPLMRAPWGSVSLAEFWGERWNRAFRDLAHTWVFLPLSKRWGPRLAVWGVFAVSGLAHELVISVPARGGYGGPLCYFILQALGCAWERKLSRGNCLFTTAFILLPAPLLFHPPFATRVMLPFAEWLTAIL